MNNGAAVHELWARLQDDMSRTIFAERVLYLMDGNWKHIQNIVGLAHRHAIAQDRQQRNGGNLFDPAAFPFSRDASVAVFGAGWLGKQIVPFLMSHGYTNIRFCDNNPTLHGQLVDSIQVISPQQLLALKDAPVIVAVKAESLAQDVSASLLRGGIDPGRIYRLPRIWRGEYFDSALFPPSMHEVYVDAGCYDSGTIRRFAEYCGGRYDAIYGFEPDPESYRRVAEELETSGLDNVHLLQKGIWSSSSSLRFRNSPHGSAAIADAGGIDISAVALDETGIEPTFIKMDVEGAELPALRGAEKTLRKHRPRLAICVYHREEDILDIPLYLQGIVPEYAFYLRHHSYSIFDTVLYATAQR